MFTAYKPEDRMPTAVDRFFSSPFRLMATGAVLLVLPIPILLIAWFVFGDAVRWLLSNQLPFSIIMMAVVLAIIIHLCAACILAERKLSAFIQDRKGPNRVGFWGMLQPVADGAKFILKEDIVPGNVDKPIFIMSPGIAFVVALIGFAVIPWAGEIHFPWMADGQTVTTQVASLDVGILYVLAVGSLSVYGVVLAGWSSNNKYSFYGGMRATAQMLSYEIPLGLGILVVLLTVGSLRLEEIVNVQASTGVWLVLVHPLAFLIMLIAAFAETNRAPFDIVECEQELIAGFHTEYSAMKLGMFYLAEYAHMVIASALLTVLFFGGGEPLPFVGLLAGHDEWWAALLRFGVIWGKVCVFLVLYMVVRWTLPRFRFDQIMRLCWKGLVPLGLAVVVTEALLIAFGFQIDPAKDFAGNIVVVGVSLLANAILLVIGLAIASQSRAPITGRQENLPRIVVKPARAES